MGSRLDVDVAGDRRHFDPHDVEVVRFGRARSVELTVPGADVHMSRHVGSFRWVDDTWVLENPAPDAPGRRRAHVDVVGLTGAVTTVPPGAWAPLPSVGEVRWRVGGVEHRLRYRFAGVRATDVGTRADLSGPATERVELTPREVDFCVLLAGPELEGAASEARPSLKEIAEAWFVSLGTVEKTLRRLRRRLAAADVVDFDDRADVRDKSARLAAAVVELGLVTAADREWALAADGRRLRSSADAPRFAPEPVR